MFLGFALETTLALVDFYMSGVLSTLKLDMVYDGCKTGMVCRGLKVVMVCDGFSILFLVLISGEIEGFCMNCGVVTVFI